MDLMGGDAFDSEEDMARMWGDSVKAVTCQHARITYEDFLLLMKGQTKDSPSRDDEVAALTSTALVDSGDLHPVLESHGEGEFSDESPSKSERCAGETADVQSAGPGDATDAVTVLVEALRSHTPTGPVSPSLLPKSAPTTPSAHKKLLDSLTFESPLSIEEEETPLSMDDDNDITSSGPGVPGSSASLTPPASPSRGAHDYVTPGYNRLLIDFTIPEKGLSLPGFPPGGAGIAKPRPYTRGRSRSLDESEDEQSNLHTVADVVRDMLLPETDHSTLNRHLENVVKDESKSALVVNRKLYRAHRQMRLAVLEASKRFEEQQAEYARQVILAAREAEGGTEQGMSMIQAGLVMRHGHTKQVSSKAIRKLLEENRAQQQALVEKANRRGGRGRRSRKKTTSDMSGMLQSLGQDEMTRVAMKAAGIVDTEAIIDTPASAVIHEASVCGASDDETIPALPDLMPAEGTLRGATVPGEFRKTNDPFGSNGRYGAVNQPWG